MYLEIAASPPPTRGQSDMTRHGANSRGKCHLLPPPFHLIPCRGGGEKDFAYRHHDGAGCDKNRDREQAERITAAGRGAVSYLPPRHHVRRRAAVITAVITAAAASVNSVKVHRPICGLEASMRREYGGGGPKAHDLRPCVRVCGIHDKNSVPNGMYTRPV